MAAKTFMEWWDEVSNDIQGPIGDYRKCWIAATEAMETKFTSTNIARDEICPHYSREYISGPVDYEIDMCHCKGKPAAGKLSPVA